MKQYSKTRQLKVLRYAKKMLVNGTVDGMDCICHAVEHAEEFYYKMCSFYILKRYGLIKYKPRKAGVAFWWPLDDKGRQKRITVLNKRIKELSKKK